MGNNHSSMKKINFEDVQTACRSPEIYLLINTLQESDQNCLIYGTILAQQEETIINKHLTNNKRVHILIYGANANDEKIFKKYPQVCQLGFYNVYIYMGGMFEWLLLQDIYGIEEFPTTSKIIDFLKYKPKQKLNVGLLEYNID